MYRSILHTLKFNQKIGEFSQNQEKGEVGQKRESNLFDQQRQSIPLQSDFRIRFALDEELASMCPH